jgi:oligopeptide transport system substrate-binding protein
MINRRTLLAATASTGLVSTLSACARSAPEPGLLRVAISTMPDSLDPARGQFAASALIYKQIHAGLTDYGPDGGLSGGLAESWTVSEGGLVWRFVLREGLLWSDGQALTATDVVWSAQRLVDPTQSFADLGDFYAVENARAVLAREMPPATLGVEAIDERVVEFRLTSPLGLFPILMREFYPFPRHAIETHGADWIRPENLVTAGAYTVSDDGQNTLWLAKNPNYFNADSVSIETIVVDAVRDASTRVRLFRSDEYDLADNPTANQIGFLRDNLGRRFQSFDAPILRYLKLNHARPELADPRVRLALSLAVDREFIAREFFSDTARPTAHVIPGPPSGPADLAQAQQIIDSLDASWLDRPLQIRTTVGENEPVAVALADDWGRLGIETEILVTYPTDLYQAVDNGDFDIAISRYNRGLKSDPFYMLDPFAPGGFADNFNWQDEIYASLMADARRQSDANARARTYAAAEARLLAQSALIPLVHERAHWLVGERLTGTRADVQPMLWRDLGIAQP